MDDTEKLSRKQYWNQVLKNFNLPLEVKESQYSTWLQNLFFQDIIKEGAFKTLIEIGSGSSAWLPFLAKKYNLLVSGLDYSEIGCKLCEKNLKILNITYDEIICQDIFNWTGNKKYDIAISFGVVEHFEYPQKVIAVCMNHITSGGIIITVIPNLLGIPGFITRKLLPDVYEIHKKINLSELVKYHESLGIITVKANYTGWFYPMLIPWSSKKNGFLFKSGRIRNFTLKLLAIFNHIISTILLKIRIVKGSKTFSPFLIYIGQVK